MKELDQLSEEERQMLLIAPAYISLLAANEDGEMDSSEKDRAIEISHIKTFASDQLLIEFYKEVDKNFSKNIESIEKELPKNKMEREVAIKNKLKTLEHIFSKLNFSFSSRLRESLRSYMFHVSKSHVNVLPSFIDPFYWLF